MKKAGRAVVVLLVLALAGALLYPTIKWHCLVPKDVKAIVVGSNSQIRDYSRSRATNDVKALLALSRGGKGNDKLPDEYSYLYSVSGVKKGSSLNSVLGSYSGESKLFNAIEGYYRDTLMEAKTLSGKVLNLGLDLRGGISVLLDADIEGFAEKLGREPSQDEILDALSADVEILSGRIDEFGLSEPDIRIQGGSQILVELAGEADSERVNSFLQGKGSLYFAIVDSELTQQVNRYYGERPSEAFAQDGSIITPSFIPENKILMGYYMKDGYGLDELRQFAVIDPSVTLDGSYIESASPSKDQLSARPVVNFTLSGEGGNLFYELTSRHKGEALAVVLDGKVRSVATINDAIRESVQISGFDEKEAKDLAVVLKSSSFPIDLTVSGQQTVGATLGEDAVNAGMLAIAIGFATIVLFMVIYYGLSGLIADIALFLNLYIMVALLSAMQFTLTLTSIAGLILTLGMAVDANVIIYERMKEELRMGKKPHEAVSIGFGRAFWTIVDSNVTTIIAALVLSFLGSSAVKGFSISLAVGIASSLFTSLYVSHLLFDFFVKEDSKKLSIAPFRSLK